MKKNILTIILIIFVFIVCLYFCFFSKTNEQILVNYNGNSLRVSVDGTSVSALPTTGIYYLVSYSCDNDKTEVTWDNDNYELVVSNGKDGGNIACDLIFRSNPLLSEMPVGSYVAYEGKGGTVGTTSVACKKNGSASSSAAKDETESPNSCLGQNAREDLDDSGYTYGYCCDAIHKYYTTGWRIAYIDEITNKVAIISAGSPECNSRTSSTDNETYIQTANALALKYCNTDFVDGNCTCTGSSGKCNSPSTDAWAINDDTFNKMTEQATGVAGGGYLYNTIDGATKCGSVSPLKVCGYNNDLISNGGYYWFASYDPSSRTFGVSWHPYYLCIYSNDALTSTYGLRPVISLSSSVFVTGGKGTMDSPYTISNNK